MRPGLRGALRDLAWPALLFAATGGVLLLTGPLAAPGRAAPAASAPASQCRADETVLYSCRFGAALGSVCGGTGTVHYRFGPAGRPAIDLASAPDWGNVHTGRVRGQGGGYQEHVRFTRGDTHYLVFRGEDGSLASRPGRTYSGIAVLGGARGERALATLACKGGARIAPGLVDGVMAQAPAGAALEELADGPFDAWF